MVLSSDKAVSRKHAVAMLKTTRTELLCENDLHAPVLATSAEEIEACHASCDGVCLVLENLGKLGSFVVVEKPTKKPTKKAPQQAQDDEDATDEDEDVSMSIQQSQTGLPPLSNATRALVDDPSQVTLHAVPPNESVVLTQLALTQQYTPENPRVIIQIGKTGSTLLLTRKPFRFMLGSSDKADYPSLKQLHKIDAHWIQPADDQGSSLTHHVTPARQFTTRQLISWLLGRTFVHPDYLQALLNRTNAADPMPPTIPPPAEDGAAFSAHAPTVSWAAWTFLAYEQRDQEVAALAKAAGASVIYVYKLGNTIAQQVKAIENMFAKNEVDKNKCFMLSTKSKKKIVNELHGRLKVVAISTKDMAKYLTNTEPTLPDGSLAPLLQDNTKSPVADATKDDSTQAPPETSHEMILPPPKVTASPSTKRKIDLPTTNETLKKHKRTEKRDRTPVKTNVAYSFKKATPQDSAEETQMPMDQEEEDPEKAAASKATVPSSAKQSEPAVTEEKAISGKNDVTEVPPPDNGNDSDEDDRPQQRRLQSDDADGWLTAAPKGKERKAFVRSKEEISEETGTTADEMVDVAPTVRVTGLVVQAQGQLTSRAAVVTSGPNYKAFRKNVVPAPARARIQFRVHMTQGAKAQEQAATQLEELEEQRRRADALFAGTGRAKAGGSSRRRY